MKNLEILKCRKTGLWNFKKLEKIWSFDVSKSWQFFEVSKFQKIESSLNFETHKFEKILSLEKRKLSKLQKDDDNSGRRNTERWCTRRGRDARLDHDVHLWRVSRRAGNQAQGKLRNTFLWNRQNFLVVLKNQFLEFQPV